MRAQDEYDSTYTCDHHGWADKLKERTQCYTQEGRKRNILSIQVSTGKAETSFLPEIQQSMSFNTGLNWGATSEPSADKIPFFSIFFFWSDTLGGVVSIKELQSWNTSAFIQITNHLWTSFEFSRIDCLPRWSRHFMEQEHSRLPSGGKIVERLLNTICQVSYMIQLDFSLKSLL